MFASHLPLASEEQEELAGYLLGDLSPEQASALEARLTQDPRLLAELQALQETLHLLPYGLPGVIPPASLRGKVMAEAGIEQVPTPLQPALSSLGFGRLTAEWRWLGGLAAVVLALLVFDNWRLRQALQLARLESVQALAHLLQQPGSRLVNLQGEAAAANLLYRPGEWQEVVLAARTRAASPDRASRARRRVVFSIGKVRRDPQLKTSGPAESVPAWARKFRLLGHH